MGRSAGSGDIGSASAKFGSVALYLAEPIQAEVMIYDRSKEPFGGIPNPIGHNMVYKKIRCDDIYVLDYGNYQPPLVALHDKDATDAYYLCPYLTRREQEKYGVEHWKFSGHPITDAEYYKDPTVLYTELQGITKSIYEDQAKLISH